MPSRFALHLQDAKPGGKQQKSPKNELVPNSTSMNVAPWVPFDFNTPKESLIIKIDLEMS